MVSNETLQEMIEALRGCDAELAEQAAREDRAGEARFDTAVKVTVKVVPDYDYTDDDEWLGIFTDRPDWYSGKLIIDRWHGQDRRYSYSREYRYWQSGETINELRRALAKAGYARHDAWLKANELLRQAYDRAIAVSEGRVGYYGVVVTGLNDDGDEVYSESCWGYEGDYLDEKFPPRPPRLGEKNCGLFGMRYKYANRSAKTGLGEVIRELAPVSVAVANELATEADWDRHGNRTAELELWQTVWADELPHDRVLVWEQAEKLVRFQVIDGENKVVSETFAAAIDAETVRQALI